MNDYTPTTEVIRAVFMGGAYNDEQAERRGLTFDRWLAAHDAEVRAGVVAEEPEWEYGVIGPTGRVVNNGDYTREQKLRRRKAGPWESGCFGHCDPEGWFTPCRVPVKQEGAGDEGDS